MKMRRRIEFRSKAELEANKVPNRPDAKSTPQRFPFVWRNVFHTYSPMRAARAMLTDAARCLDMTLWRQQDFD